MKKKVNSASNPDVPVHPWRVCPYGEHWVRTHPKYDDLIAGWTQYWNDVLKPDVPLDTNLVKALIPIAYQFIESRPWPIRDCKSFVKTLKNLIRGTSHACISASYIGKEEKNERGQNERIGIFHRLKTKKGCEGEECMLTAQTKREYCPNLKSWAQN